MHPIAAKVIRSAVTGAVVVGVGVLSGVASAGYGPALPPGGAVPGGFANVVATWTSGPVGGRIAAHIGATSAEVVVPAQHLHVPLQLTLTTPNLRKSGGMLSSHSRWRGRVVGGVALNARMADGVMVRGRLGGMVTLHLHNPRFRPGDRVLKWNGHLARFVLMPSSRVVVRRGHISVRVEHGREILVLENAHRIRRSAKH